MIKRNLFDLLVNHLSAKEITVIIGPRQVGKTTLMKELIKILNFQGQKTVFLNLDVEDNFKYFSSQQALIQKLKLEFGNEKGYCFIDEIQRKKDTSLFLKGIFDLDLPIKFIVSGSGSLELKEQIHESLSGRKRIFELNPVNWKEFIDYKTNYKYSSYLNDFFKLEQHRTLIFLDEYLQFGGYPRVILEDQQIEKFNMINEIYQSYIEKDITYLLKIEKRESFSQLIRLLAEQIGQLINYTELSQTLGISLITLKNYLWFAEKTFVIKTIAPFFKNFRKEITKSQVVYFYDLGLRNLARGIFNTPLSTQDKSFLFQNLILHLLEERFRYESKSLNFWRSKDHAEVDFIINLGERIIPIEVKYKDLIKPEIEKSLRNFILKYSPQKAYVINKSFSAQIKINSTEVYFLPFWQIDEIS